MMHMYVCKRKVHNECTDIGEKNIFFFATEQSFSLSLFTSLPGHDRAH